MNRQAWIAWLLILLQAGMFWYFSETVLFPVLVVTISLPAVWWRRRWELPSVHLPWIDLVLAGFCAMKWNLAPYDPPTMNGFLMYPLVHAAAQFFLLVQVARLWARRPDRPLPMYLPLLAVLVFICLGDVSLSRFGRYRRMYQNATLTLVGLSCLYYSVARRRQDPPSQKARWLRPALSAGVLVVCALTARASNTWLLRNWNELEHLMMRASGARPNADRRNVFIGFSGQAPLGSVQLLRSSLSDEIALRVISESPPGYLRGAVFERYTPHGWEWHSDWLPLTHTRQPLPKESRPERSDNRGAANSSVEERPLFLLRPNLSNDLRPVTIWRTPAVDRFSFMPLASSQVEAPAEMLLVDRHGVVAPENWTAGACMTAWVQNPSTASQIEPIVQPSNWENGQSMDLPRLETLQAKVRLRQLPNRMDAQVLELARRLFADCKTPTEKIAAVRKYFASYQYDLTIRVPPGRDALTYFLLEKPAAHCEFFASGTAVLLRLGGIPCRYVTGYAGAELNSFGHYWIVRQRDAHAWVEAHVPDEGWIVVDSTPADFVPPTVESFGLWHFWDDLSLRSQMIRTALASETFTGKLAAAKLLVMALLTTIPGWILTGGLLFLIVRQIRFARKAAQVIRLEPALIELRRMLAELDRRLCRLDLERSPHETLHQFSERLRAAADSRPILYAAADWYQHYAATRYGLSPDADGQESLRSELQQVCEQMTPR